MADGRHVEKMKKMLEMSHNSPTNRPTVTKLGWLHPITSPPHVRHGAVAMPLPSNGALNIQLLWASGGQTRDPILMKFAVQ